MRLRPLQPPKRDVALVMAVLPGSLILGLLKAPHERPLGDAEARSRLFDRAGKSRELLQQGEINLGFGPSPFWSF